jgi:TonB family protein
MNTRLMSLCSLAAALSVSASNSLSAADQQAMPVSQVAPVYSHELRASDVEGEVVVAFTISSTGDVINPVVVSSTDHLLVYPTLAAVRKWKFTPAMKDGVAVSVRAVQPIAFKIPELHPDSARLITQNSHPASQEKDHSAFN